MNELVKAKPGQYLTFQLMQEQYGLPIETIREINQYAEITPVPRTPDFIKGVMNLRGKIIPVVDLRLKFGLSHTDVTRDTCIVVIDSTEGQVGMVVDAVREVVDLDEKQIEPAPVLAHDQHRSFITGMGKLDKHVVILVDIVSEFSHDQLSRISELHQAQSAA